MLIDLENAESQRKTNLLTSLPLQKYEVKDGLEFNLKYILSLSDKKIKTPFYTIYNDNLLYIVSNYIVIHDLKASQQSFLTLERTFTSTSIGCLTVHSLSQSKALIAYSDTPCEVNEEEIAVDNKTFIKFTKTNTKILYRVRVAIVGLKRILTHFSYEIFKIKQIEFNNAKYCYTLCESKDKVQVINVWNYEKAVHLMSIELKQVCDNFTVNPNKNSQVSVLIKGR